MQSIFAKMYPRLKIWVNNSIVVILALLLMNYCVPYNNLTAPSHVNLGTGATVFSQNNCNEIESVLELVTEEWMGMDNFVPEQESDDDPEDISKIKTLFRVELSTTNIASFLPFHIVQYPLVNPAYMVEHHNNIPTPPPDIA